MSTFEGKLHEESLDFIRIDDFQLLNYDGSSFFLSHFHTDHFKGIFNTTFLKYVVQKDSKMLYCSAITKSLLLNNPKCKIPSNKIFALTVNAPYILEHEGREPVVVTTIPAGHIPGSVMFFFEQGNTRVLYTGDFRIDPSDLSKFRILHDKSGAMKKINSLYLDTTFCDPNWLSFPSRMQSLEDLLTLINDWLENDSTHEIGIWYNSYHGLEHLLIQLSRALKLLVWVIDTESYMNYSCIPELHDALCRKKSTSRIHLCPVKAQGDCPECLRNRDITKTIKPCAQSFHQQQLERSRLKQGKDVTRIAYSMHCSLEELISTVKYLSPEIVYPCVIPNHLTAEEVLNNLNLDVKKLKKDLENKGNELFSDSDSSDPPTKKFCLNQITDDYSPSSSSGACADEELIIELSSDEEAGETSFAQNDFSGLDSPPI